MRDPCDLLAWDTAFWGMPIARVSGNALAPADLPAIDRWCARHAVACLFLLAPCDDAALLAAARAAGFVETDRRITLEQRLAGPGAPPSPAIRLATPEDIPRLRPIAAASHEETRFFADARFPRDRARELYATWIERSVGGFADAVLVWDDGGRPVGYVTLHDEPGAVRIGLLAVDANERGRGIGRALVEAGLAWARERGADRASLVTQGRNAAARSLYAATGFSTRECAIWLHRWGSANGEGTG
jgi:ribosomal protein S18 acetylase RimI-like enzyme